uniref:Uncharacterized protein n=1 Tax=Moniliophthora roreri TaxID=221103 RepID=A0A0W0GAB6_MONRR
MTPLNTSFFLATIILPTLHLMPYPPTFMSLRMLSNVKSVRKTRKKRALSVSGLVVSNHLALRQALVRLRDHAEDFADTEELFLRSG